MIKNGGRRTKIRNEKKLIKKIISNIIKTITIMNKNLTKRPEKYTTTINTKIVSLQEKLSFSTIFCNILQRFSHKY